MTRHTKRIIGAVAIVIGLGVVFFAVLHFSGALKQGSDTAQDEPETSQAQQAEESEAVEEQVVNKELQEAPEIDKSTLSTLDIPGASLKLSFVKGVGGFEYRIFRSSDSRQHIELSSQQLIATKCDDDAGVFATIIEAPNESEMTTLSKTAKVGEAVYGLLLTSPTCTDNPDLLKKYQDAFSAPFGLLEKL